jgi:hypothetical protein
MTTEQYKLGKGVMSRWYDNLNDVKTYMDAYCELPSPYDTNHPYVKSLGVWMYNQNKNYNKNKEIMSVPCIRTKWEEFVYDPDYIYYFISNEEKWLNTLDDVERYMDDNGERPSPYDTNPYAKILGVWLYNQQVNYEKKQHFMVIPSVRTKWSKFINDYVRVLFR